MIIITIIIIIIRKIIIIISKMMIKTYNHESNESKGVKLLQTKVVMVIIKCLGPKGMKGN